jgi:hypothetical protein
MLREEQNFRIIDATSTILAGLPAEKAVWNVAFEGPNGMTDYTGTATTKSKWSISTTLLNLILLHRSTLANKEFNDVLFIMREYLGPNVTKSASPPSKLPSVSAASIEERS